MRVFFCIPCISAFGSVILSISHFPLRPSDSVRALSDTLRVRNMGIPAGGYPVPPALFYMPLALCSCQALLLVLSCLCSGLLFGSLGFIRRQG